MPEKIDTKRAMGVYVTAGDYPPKGDVGSTPFITIEQVHGDCTVSTIAVTSVEAWHVRDRIREELERR